jgi:nucleotide-binding universal stress UspA family protein
MYKRIMVPVDNSDYSRFAVDAAAELAEHFDSYVCGTHVYASRLHDRAFRRMEEGLPEQYQEENELQRQRKVHDSLIDKGLVLISESMLTDLQEKAKALNLKAETKVLEGKNFSVLLKDTEESEYDLVAMGALGLGKVKRSTIGSVCDRVCKDASLDILVLKKPMSFDGAKVICAIDGSPNSYSALRRCLTMAKEFGAQITAVHVFDPAFHTVAFKSISEVLTDEAAKVFKFEEQQKLHDEIIDNGLKRVGERHLERAKSIAAEEGIDIETVILAGKPFDRIIDLVDERGADIVVAGRYGTHRAPDTKIGSHTYNILLSASCNVLIVTKIDEDLEKLEFHGSAVDASKTAKQIAWSQEAEARLNNIPAFVRNMVRKSIEEYAVGKGCDLIDENIMNEARGRMGM